MPAYGPNQIVRQFYEHPPRSHLYRPASANGDHLPHHPAAPFLNESPTSAEGCGADQPHPDRSKIGVSADDPLQVTDPLYDNAAPPRRTLSTVLLTGLMYTFTISGAYGIEESVMGGGVLLTILSVMIIPLIIGAPTALVVAELASAVPSNAGFLMWIKLSFHRTVYLAMALMSLIYIAVDNALYPAMFSEYLCTAITCSDAQVKWLRVGMLLFVYVFNLFGVETVGVASVVLTILTVAPFILLFLMQQLSTRFYINWAAVAYVPDSIQWTTFIATASWCLSGLEQAGTVVEEVKDPQRTIIGSLVPLMGLAIITYIPPILSGASTSSEDIDLSEWTTGYWAEVSYKVGGQPLKVVAVAGGVLSALGLTLSALCTTTRVIAGVALTEAFPGRTGVWLSQRNERFGTYHWTLTLNVLITGIFSTVLGFGSLVKVDQCLYGIRVVVILVSFYRFRHLYPHLPRPFRIPFQGWRLHVMMGVAIASAVALTIVSLCQEWLTVVLCLVVVSSSIVVSLAYCHFFRKRDFAGRVVTFVATGPDDPSAGDEEIHDDGVTSAADEYPPPRVSRE